MGGGGLATDLWRLILLCMVLTLSLFIELMFTSTLFSVAISGVNSVFLLATAALDLDRVAEEDPEPIVG